LIIIISCKTTYKISYHNFASTYSAYKEKLNPEYVFYNIDNDTTLILCKVPVGNLLKIRPMGETNFYAGFKLNVEVFSSYQSNLIIDSVSLIYNDSIANRDSFIASTKVVIKSEGIFPVKLILSDLNSNKSSTKIINLNKFIGKSRNDFMLVDENNNPLFTNFLPEDIRFRIKVNNLSLSNLIVRCYFRNFNIAALPFVYYKEESFNFEPDSLFTIPLENGISNVLQFVKEGIYHIQYNVNIKEGYTIFRFYRGFPQIRTPEQMIYPLRYLTSKNEYNKLINADNKKKAVDEFWLSTAGNELRGKELIKKYYNRVQYANIYFTSYKEGWKTDRGLIYIIYGDPNIVYFDAYSETWIYGEEFNNMSITFIFNKRENPFTDNDFILVRSPIYKDTWYNVIDVWRR